MLWVLAIKVKQTAEKVQKETTMTTSSKDSIRKFEDMRMMMRALIVHCKMPARKIQSHHCDSAKRGSRDRETVYLQLAERSILRRPTHEETRGLVSTLR